MKDPMTQDVARAAMKSAPAITGAVVVRHSIDWSVLVSCVTMTYTAILAFDVTARHWGLWRAWLKERAATLRRLWNWLRGRQARQAASLPARQDLCVGAVLPGVGAGQQWSSP